METQQGYKTKNRTGNETGDDVAKTYNFGYNYVETRPHILDAIDVGGGLTRNYANDASGNNTGYQLDYGGYMINVTIDWDEEDRIKQYTFVTPGGISNEYYWYDNEVQRMIKRRVASGSGNSISNETLYPSQYYSVYIDDTSDEIIMRTKNVYVGNQRVVSVLNPNEQTRYEYYYHTDHLGSTTYLTDRDGKLKEHIEYTPWGEGWIEQSQGFPTDYLPYKFTGKELDATGLYYYGARYYDPRISMWLSADPALGRYLQAGGKATSEGVFNSKNLGLYTYCHQNPLIYLDPDGNDVILLNESKAVIGCGHNAVLVGNDKNGWTYFGKEGLNNNLFVSYKTLDDFKKSEQAQKYDRAYGVNTSEAQDNAMIEYGKENVNSNYSLIEAGKTDNCADLSADIIQAGNKVIDKDAKNVYISKPKVFGATVPNFQYMGFKNGNKENGYKVDLNEK